MTAEDAIISSTEIHHPILSACGDDPLLPTRGGAQGRGGKKGYNCRVSREVGIQLARIS